MFEVNMSPILVNLGGLEIRYYGLVYVLTVLLVYLSFKKHKHKLKLNEDQIDTLLMWLVFGMIIGARLMHFLINEPSVFLYEPTRLFMLWRGGMSFFGV